MITILSKNYNICGLLKTRQIVVFLILKSLNVVIGVIKIVNETYFINDGLVL